MNYEINPKGKPAAPPEPVALQRMTVQVIYKDGSEETFEALGQIQFNPALPFVMLTLSQTEEVGIVVQNLRRWKVKRSKLSVVGN